MTESLNHHFQVRGGVLRCIRPQCDTVWGEGPADCASPVRLWAARLRELTEEANRIVAAGDAGEPEVRRLEQLLAEAKQILDDSGVTAAVERRAFARRLHYGRGHPVDLPPRRDIFDWIRAHYGHGNGHIHW